ncbi:MAG: ATP-binding protein [Kiritimatiellae bacterium]|nr:ATP-binding protein [Kiritimatiellia bacterium]
MQDYEKLGAFYLGKVFDPAAGSVRDELLLYDSRDLTTHAVVLGMTGSGKTGLCLALLEEAAMDGVPAIAIDPKGDLGNLLLAFPALQPADFRPWVDEGEAARKGMTPDDYAARTAETWRKGLEDWGQDGGRIARMKEAADFAIYTPGDASGRPLQILRSFAAPSEAVAGDSAALRDRVLSAVSGLLGLLGINADPVQSREHILLSNIFDKAWREGRDLDIAALIGDIQKPPFDKVGVFDLESFFPAKDRFSLAMALNNLIASPGFSSWMEGEPLDVQRLLYTPEGKSRISILSIAHLSETERMFFVTILLNEVLAWVRAQSGTSSLRALLYMDEIFGYFPPSANPPSKTAMLTLLKQARAYGLGCVLSTQNPVDLDYKGLANTGTWIIGRLQTERDKLRVMEGLEGAMPGSAFDRGAMDKLLAGLGNRVFLLRNVHDDQPVLFQSRWAMSYLRGPMTLPQIRQLMASSSIPLPSPPSPSPSPPPSAGRPVLPPDVPEFFLRAAGPAAYRPAVLGVSQLHFVDGKSGVDTWETRSLLAPLGDDGFAAWEEAEPRGDLKDALDGQPAAGSTFGVAPAVGKKSVENWGKTLEAHLHQTATLDLISCPALKLTTRPGESEGDFSVRVAQALREKRDAEVDKLRARYAPKLQTLNDQVRRAEERVEREKAQVGQQKMSTMLNVGTTLLGALFGRRTVSIGNISRAGAAARSAGRLKKEQADVARAGESVAVVKQRLADLEQQFARDTAELQGRFEPGAAEIVRTQIRPRKADISIGRVGLCWVPGP